MQDEQPCTVDKDEMGYKGVISSISQEDEGMIYEEKELEMEGVLQTARQMCTAARTAPKARGLNECCDWCNQANCQGCRENQSVCVFDPMDLGIALGSAVSVASMNHVDNRIMFSVGKGALSLGMLGPEVNMILGIPLAAAGKAPYFDRK